MTESTEKLIADMREKADDPDAEMDCTIYCDGRVNNLLRKGANEIERLSNELDVLEQQTEKAKDRIIEFIESYRNTKENDNCEYDQFNQCINGQLDTLDYISMEVEKQITGIRKD